MSAPVGKATLARNTAFAVLGHAVTLVVPLLMTPYIVHRVGMEQYGIWAALSVMVLLASQYDFGLWNAIARETAIRRARDDRDGLRTLLATCFTFDLLVAPVLFLGMLFSGRFLLSVLLPGADPALAYPVLVVLTLQAVLMPWVRQTTHALNGCQRVDLASLVTLAATPVSIAGTILFLEAGYGLLGMAVNGAILLVLQLVALLVVLRGQGFPVSLSPFRYDRREHRALLGFGGKVEIGRLLQMLFRCDRLVLGAVGVLSSRIGAYQLGAALSDRISSSIGVFSSAVLPAASDLVARGELGRLRQLFMRATKYHALAAMGLIGFAVLFGPDLFFLWMGQALCDSVDVLRIMAVGGACLTIAWPSTPVAIALGRPWLGTVSRASGLAFAVLLYMTVGRRYDVEGLAWAVSLGLVLAQVIQMIGLRRALAFEWREYVGNAFLKPLVLAAPLALVFGLRTLLTTHFFEVDGRLSAAAVVGPAFLLAAGLGWAAARAFGVLDQVDVDLMKSVGRRSPA